MKTFFRCICCFLCVAGVFSLTGAEHIDILRGEENKVHCGFVFGNRYGTVGFLNPSTSSSRVYPDDFNVIPRQNMQGKRAAEEHEARVRLFFRPDIRLRTVGRRPMVIHGKKNWELGKLKNGVSYSRTFVRGSNRGEVTITVTMPEDRAEMFVEYTVKNTGTSAFTANSVLGTSFLRNGLMPLDFFVQREMVRYINGERTAFRGNEYTVLDSKVQSYWWRRLIKEPGVFQNYYNRERIPFDHKLMIKPEMFGFTKLAGNNVLIWDLGKDCGINRLDINWESEVATASPEWIQRVEPGKEHKIKFRLMMFKDLRRVDLIGKDWIFGFYANGELLTVQVVALHTVSGTQLAVTVNDENSQTLVNQRSEMPSISPFTPGQIVMRAASAFRYSSVYPIKVVMGYLKDNSNFLEITENIVP